MKKIIYILVLLIVTKTNMFSQTTSPMWSTIQNTNFTATAVAVHVLDAVDQNVVWATGFDPNADISAYSWFTTTSNGGASYTSGNIFSDTNTYIVVNIEGIDANNAWISAYYKSTSDRGVVYHTTNGGATWTNGGAAGMFSVTGSSFLDFVSFVTPTVGIAVGDPVSGDFEIYRTADAGNTWSAIPGSVIPNALSGEYGVTDSYAKFGASNFWFGTNKNRIFRSTDAGQTWSVSPVMTSTLGAAFQITDIAFRDANNGLAKAYFGTGNYSGLTLWKTTNGGASWTQIPGLDPNFGRYALCSIPGTSWYASCEEITNPIISYSTDDGTTWNNWGGSGIPYYAIDFVSNTVGWAGSVSSSTNAAQQGMFKYSGQPLSINEKNYTPFAIDLYPNPNNGILNVNLPASIEAMQINVLDIFGKIVYSENLKTVSPENHILNLQFLDKGLYTIVFQKGDQRSNQKIIIQ